MRKFWKSFSLLAKREYFKTFSVFAVVVILSGYDYDFPGSAGTDEWKPQPQSRPPRPINIPQTSSSGTPEATPKYERDVMGVVPSSSPLPTPQGEQAQVDENGWYGGYAVEAQQKVWEVVYQYFSHCDDERYFTVRVLPLGIGDIYKDPDKPEYLEIIGLTAWVTPWSRDSAAEQNQDVDGSKN